MPFSHAEMIRQCLLISCREIASGPSDDTGRQFGAELLHSFRRDPGEGTVFGLSHGFSNPALPWSL